MNDKIASLVIFWTFMLIMVNAFIAVSGGLKTETGVSMSSIIGADSNALGSDFNRAYAYQYGTTATSTATLPGATEGLSICKIAGVLTLGITDGVCNVGEELFTFANLLVFGVENYMQVFSTLFPDFRLIFDGIKYLALALKLMFIFYIGAIIVRLVLGRSQ